MTAPRLEIDLDKIYHNARSLVQRLANYGIGVTGVLKSTLGSPEIASVLIRAGIGSIGDSRIENLEAMHRAQLSASMVLIRTPMLSQASEVVKSADVSFNSELEVIRMLSLAAQKAGRTHGIVLMVELGDLREGIMPGEMDETVRELRSFPGIILKGLGTNLACRSGVSPDEQKMNELSSLADSLEKTFHMTLDIISGGNSANLGWALGDTSKGRINNLRLGESILLGREPLHRQPIEGLHTDAISLVAEVIESKVKPSQPWGEIAQSAFGSTPKVPDEGDQPQAILAIGRQDIDPSGIQPPPGMEILGASSDHLIVKSDVSCGAEITFGLNYSAMLRAMTSPFVTKVMTGGGRPASIQRRSLPDRLGYPFV